MEYNRVTVFTALGLGTIATAVVSAAVTSSLFLKGDVVYDTTDNPTPAIVIDTTDNITFSGSDVVQFDRPTRKPLYGTLALTEENSAKGGSGTQVITNPYSSYLICESVTFYVTTTAAPAISADIYFSTGATVVATGSGTGIEDNYNFAVGVHTFTGSSLAGSDVEPKHFVLAPTSSTTENKSVVIRSKSGTGAGLVGRYYIPCEFLTD